MTFDPTKPVQTRDGNAVRIICTDRVSVEGRSILSLMKSGDTEVILLNYPDGKSYSTDTASHLDLVNVPVRTSTWENVYETTSGSMTYASKEKAKYNRSRMSRFLGLLRRDFEDGVFVSAEFEPLTSEE